MSKFTYLKEYNEFIRLSNKQIEKQIPIVEKLDNKIEKLSPDSTKFLR